MVGFKVIQFFFSCKKDLTCIVEINWNIYYWFTHHVPAIKLILLKLHNTEKTADAEDTTFSTCSFPAEILQKSTYSSIEEA